MNVGTSEGELPGGWWKLRNGIIK